MPYRPRDIYRGRRKHRLPLMLAIFLPALVIVTAVTLFYTLQQFLVYDQTGVRLELPFRAEATAAPDDAAVVPVTVEPVEVEVIYEDPDFSDLDLAAWQDLPPLRAKFVPFSDAADETRLSRALDAVGEQYDGVVLEVKGPGGALAWASSCEMAAAYGTAGSMDYTDIVAGLHERGLTVGARLSCLADDLLGARNWPVTLRDRTGQPYQDSSGQYWLDPYNRSVREYLEDLMAELAAMGFDELILADLRHPVSERTGDAYAEDDDTEGGDDDAGAPDTGDFTYSVTVLTTASPVNAVCQLGRTLAESMAETGVTVSAVIDENSLLTADAARTGQALDIFWRIFSRLYCPCDNWNAMRDLEAAAEYSPQGDITARFVPVCEYFPEDMESWLILPTL